MPDSYFSLRALMPTDWAELIREELDSGQFSDLEKTYLTLMQI